MAEEWGEERGEEGDENGGEEEPRNKGVPLPGPEEAGGVERVMVEAGDEGGAVERERAGVEEALAEADEDEDQHQLRGEEQVVDELRRNQVEAEEERHGEARQGCRADDGVDADSRAHGERPGELLGGGSDAEKVEEGRDEAGLDKVPQGEGRGFGGRHNVRIDAGFAGGCVDWMRSVVRSVKLVSYFLAAALELVVTRPQTVEKRADWLHRFCARVLRGFGVDLNVEGKFPARGALISNHLSYVDIIVYSAMKPVVFCAKGEMESWPLLGWMAKMAGTVFVDRGGGGSSERAKDGMKAAAEAGVPVLFYPEGTTSNGTGILPFRTGLLAQALAAEEPITTAFIHYTLEPGNGGATVEDNVCFWDDTPMLKHIFRFVGLNGVHAWVKIAEGPIVFSEPEGDMDRKQAGVEAREAMLELAGRGLGETVGRGHGHRRSAMNGARLGHKV